MNKNVNVQDNQLQLEKMRYNNNSLAYLLGMLAILFSVLACFIGLNSLQPSSALTVFIVLLNIAILLFGFLSAEKVKTYTKKYTYFMYALGGACIARIFIYPLMLIVNYQKFLSVVFSGGNENVPQNYELAKAQYSDILGVTIIGNLAEENGVYKIVDSGYLWSNGTFRGVLLIVLLGLAATCFIAAGFINYRKEKQLSSYLQSIGAKR